MRNTIKITFSFMTVVLLVFIFNISFSTAEELQDAADSQDQYAVQRIILLAPSAPFVIELSVLVDKVNFRSTTTDYIERLFRSLDRDQDGQIDLKEIKNLPAFGIKRYDQGTPMERMNLLETSPYDHRLSIDEFAAYIQLAQGTAFRVKGAPTRSSQVIDLFRKLDQDGDGSISDEEFRASSQSLFYYDRDEDQVFNLVELQPFGTGATPVSAQPVSREIAETPFLQLDHDKSLKTAIDRLFQKYVEYTNANKDALSIACLSAEKSDVFRVSQFDLDQDGYLNHEELFRYLQNPVAGLKLQISLPRSQSFRPQLKLLKRHSTRISEVEIISASRLHLHVDSLYFELRAKSSRHMFADTVRFYQTRFRVVDGDKNGYLSQSEFMQLNIPNTDYKKIDQDKDDMLTVKELTSHLMRDTAAVQERVVMTVQNDGKSLFEILDTDRDQRLSPRELQNSLQRVQEYDGNRDHSLDTSELRGHYKLTFELGKPELFVFAPRDNSRSMGQSRTVQRTLSGPRWFQRMDRNRDGDISPHEFLFEASLFEKYDRNQDQLISPEEAETIHDQQNTNTIK